MRIRRRGSAAEPIIPPIMWLRTWQCMCHSPTAGSARMNLVPSSTVNMNEFAGPNVRVSSNWEVVLFIGLLPWIVPGSLPCGPGMIQRWPWMWNVWKSLPIPITPKRIRVLRPATIVGVLPRYLRPLIHMPASASVWKSWMYERLRRRSAVQAGAEPEDLRQLRVELEHEVAHAGSSAPGPGAATRFLRPAPASIAIAIGHLAPISG